MSLAINSINWLKGYHIISFPRFEIEILPKSFLKDIVSGVTYLAGYPWAQFCGKNTAGLNFEPPSVVVKFGYPYKVNGDDM